MTADHADQVLAIYQAGLDTGQAGFEFTAPAWEAWDADHLAEHRLVALDPAGRAIGWAAVSAVSSRCVYAGVVEHSVYVDPEAQGRGAGAPSIAHRLRGFSGSSPPALPGRRRTSSSRP
ncbi:GNAT family N-acetyltransferase [Amycolatopsis sp. NPDC004169]|uniref:GNAT family N-acetyltransferase n=1 Tax=Amycolatopsis sp. NPDC004169 TaxID=3154453 RepID=UPI0033BBFC1E